MRTQNPVFRPMRVLLLTHYFPPETGAPQARLSEMGRHWAAMGHKVTVLTAFPNHPTGVIPPEYRGRTLMVENMAGMQVVRTWVYATPNEGIIKKTLGHLSFMASSVLLGLWRIRPPDVIVVSSPTFFSVFSAWLLAKLYRVPWVFEVRDLWPAIFVDLGVLKNRFIIRVLERLELALYRSAALVVPVTYRFKRDIVGRGIPGHKVAVITNGADIEQYAPRTDKSFAAEVGITDKTVVLYLGAHGISHGLSAILEAASHMQGHSDIFFLFVGEGAEKQKLMDRAEAKGLENIRFVPAQPKERVPDIYAAADICLVPLRNVPLFDAFIPSKMFEIMASGKPIVGSVQGEAKDILYRSRAALLAEPENSEKIAEAILTLADDPELREQLGGNGRRFVETNYSREDRAAEYASLLEGVIAEGQRDG